MIFIDIAKTTMALIDDTEDPGSSCDSRVLYLYDKNKYTKLPFEHEQTYSGSRHNVSRSIITDMILMKILLIKRLCKTHASNGNS